MIRSSLVHTIQEMILQGKSQRAVARELGLARNTVSKYAHGAPPAKPRPRRASKLDPFRDQVRRWVEVDHLYNCETLFQRLQAAGYTGKISILKDLVRPWRPRAVGKRPIVRFETKPGEQLQFDWGEFVYEQDGQVHKFFGFTAVLGYSRMRFVTFTKRADAPTMIRCLLEAFEYFGGLPQAVLTDRMKTVLLEMEAGKPKWHPLFADLMASLGIVPRVCKARTPQTKGKVERSVGVVKAGFWPGVTFVDVDDLNRQARVWCDGLNQRVHQTTHQRPIERWSQEALRPLPEGWVWERFASEERKVTWDGYFSYDGVLYGLPGPAQVAGGRVQVRERHGQLAVWNQGQLLLTLAKRSRAQEVVPHPDQFKSILPTAAARAAQTPIGHQVVPPLVAQRSLADYDALYHVEVRP